MHIIAAHLVTSMGVDMGDLFPVGARIGGPSAKLISILGGVLLEVSGKSCSTGTTADFAGPNIRIFQSKLSNK